MNTLQAVQARIYELVEERGWSLNHLAEVSAVPPSTLKSIMNNDSENPGIVTIKKLCDGLQIPLPDFFNCKLFYDLEQEIQ